MKTIIRKIFCFKKKYHVIEERDFLSRSHLESFTEFGVKYSCVLQYMVWRKAVLFSDYSAVVRLMKAKTTREMIKIGRSVIGFDENVWRMYKRDILKQAFILKLTQSKESREKYLSLGGGTFLFAAPHEVYGIGIKSNSEEIWKLSNHNGENLLGEVLSEIFTVIKKMRIKL